MSFTSICQDRNLQSILTDYHHITMECHLLRNPTSNDGISVEARIKSIKDNAPLTLQKIENFISAANGLSSYVKPLDLRKANEACGVLSKIVERTKDDTVSFDRIKESIISILPQREKGCQEEHSKLEKEVKTSQITHSVLSQMFSLKTLSTLEDDEKQRGSLNVPYELRMEFRQIIKRGIKLNLKLSRAVNEGNTRGFFKKKLEISKALSHASFNVYLKIGQGYEEGKVFKQYANGESFRLTVSVLYNELLTLNILLGDLARPDFQCLPDERLEDTDSSVSPNSRTQYPLEQVAEEEPDDSGSESNSPNLFNFPDFPDFVNQLETDVFSRSKEFFFRFRKYLFNAKVLDLITDYEEKISPSYEQLIKELRECEKMDYKTLKDKWLKKSVSSFLGENLSLSIEDKVSHLRKIVQSKSREFFRIGIIMNYKMGVTDDGQPMTPRKFEQMAPEKRDEYITWFLNEIWLSEREKRFALRVHREGLELQRLEETLGGRLNRPWTQWMIDSFKVVSALFEGPKPENFFRSEELRLETSIPPVGSHPPLDAVPVPPAGSRPPLSAIFASGAKQKPKNTKPAFD